MQMNLFWKFAGTAMTMLAVSACSSGSSTSTSTTTTTQASNAPIASHSTKKTAANGAQIYANNCSSCHQATGKGVPGNFPPLAGNAVVTGDVAKVASILKYGLNGKIDVGGKTYNGMMPAWSGQLSNDQIAAVLTYVRSSWGNHAGPVTVAQVAAAKK
ncbi:MAG: cytochrome c [Candidatus Eremiobacteraeota bacterium]|nr:cytochrome c [Candidatus Eremiobacteraeota bacterium]